MYFSLWIKKPLNLILSIQLSYRTTQIWKKNKEAKCIVDFFWAYIYNNALILYGVHILFPNPTQLPFPLPLPSAFVTDPAQKKTKFKSIAKKTETEEKTNKQNLGMETAVWPSESHSVPLSLGIFTYKCSLQRIIGLAWGLWLVLRYWYWSLIGTPRYPVVVLCQRDLIALNLQVQPFHTLQQFLKGGVMLEWDNW